MQISLQSLFVMFGCCAVFCVAILNANPAWVIVLRGIAVVSLLFALLAIWYRRAEKRAYWVGYLHGGGAYALLVFYALGGMTQNPVWNDGQIVSGELAQLVYRRLPASKKTAVTINEVLALQLLPESRYSITGTVGSSAPSNFRYLFHSAFIIFSGWIGGLAGVWAFKTRNDSPVVPKLIEKFEADD